MLQVPFSSWIPRLAAAAALPLLLAHAWPGQPLNAAAPPLAATRTITVNAASPQQTMRGWEVLAEANEHRTDFPAFQNAVLDKVAQAGFNRVRLEVRAGAENSVDAYANWRAAGFPQGTQFPNYVTWRAKRYETINDNPDPNVINPAGFHFTELDDLVDSVVNPLRTRLAARGEALYVNLNYVVGLPQVTSGAYYVHQAPAEYAEFALAAFQHLQQRYGWVPNGMELVLEPDNNLPIWTPQLVGQVMAATGARLNAAGYTPDFIAPSTVCMAAAVDYYDGIVAVPNALRYFKELSYHRYCAADLGTAQTIAARAANAGIATSMLEWWDPRNDFRTLHEDLEFARNGAWQQGAMVDVQNDHTVGTVSFIDPAVPSVARFTNPTQWFRRYFEFVRMGAVRLATSSDSSETNALAFRNTNGAFTVVVKATAAGAIAVAGLPAGIYGIDYTASAFNDPGEPNLIGTQPDQTIAAGQVLTTSIPAWGVITIHGKTGGGSGGAGEICGDLKDNNGNGLVDERCPSPVPPPPGDAAGFVAAVSGGLLTAQWRAPITGGAVTGYVIEAGRTPGSTLVSLPVGAVTQVALPGVPNGTYVLRVRAVGPGGTGAASNEAAITAGGCAAAPKAPRGFTAAANGPMVSLTWQDDEGCEGRRIHLLAGSAPGRSDLGDIPLTQPGTFGPVPSGEYFLHLVAETARGTSAPSNEVALRPAGTCAAPAVPMALSAWVQDQVLSVQWSPVNVTAAQAVDAVTPLSYVVEVGRAPGSSDLGVYPLGRTTTLATPLSPGTFVFRVRATSGCGVGPASNELTLVVP